jgi:hypothetical protein
MKVLKLDMDFKPSKQWLKEWVETRYFLLEKLGYRAVEHDIFETTRGIHIYIKLDREVSDREANKLQFLLGDDYTRVKINQWRIERGIKNWNKLFHKVLYRKKAKTVTCYYCGNKIPIGD